MQRAYKLALIDKKRSDQINSRARKIMAELRRMNCQLIEPKGENA